MPGHWSGTVLAAQMGFLPGTVWIIVGVIFAGAVQDMITLFFSMRRDGKGPGRRLAMRSGRSAASPPWSPSSRS